MRVFYLFTLFIILVNCQRSSPIDSQQPEEQRNWFYWSVDWHPGKDQFVAGGSNDHGIKLFSSHDYRMMDSFPYLGTVTKTKWHPTQNKLAIAVQDGKSFSTIRDLDKNILIGLDSVSREGARAIGWNYTGELLAVGDYEGFLTFYDDEGVFIRKIDTNQKGLIGLDWHPNENMLVTVGDKITMYDYFTDSLQRINDREEATEVLMLCVAWHPGGDFLVTGDYGDPDKNYSPLLQYWNSAGKKMKADSSNKAEIRNMSWSADSQLLATASDKIRLWNGVGELVAEAPSKNLLWGVDWNQDGSKLVTTDVAGKIIVWDRHLNKLREI